MNVHSMRPTAPTPIPYAKSPAPRGGSAQKVADKREAILDAALELFAERGFHGTAVPLVAERAKVGAGTIYRYFASKEELANALFKLHKANLGEALMRGFPFEAPAHEQFHFFWRRAAAFAKNHPQALRFLELHHHQDYLDAESREIELRALTPAHAFFEQAGRNQVMKPFPSEVLMAIVWGSFVGLVKASWAGRIELTAKVLDQAETCCWEAIRR
jgi:AcrR family transcriptional regulator